MTDTVSWTEPCGSTRERLYLGIGYRRAGGDGRGVAWRALARRVGYRCGGRCAHYGRGVNGGQRASEANEAVERACAARWYYGQSETLHLGQLTSPLP